MHRRWRPARWRSPAAPSVLAPVRQLLRLSHDGDARWLFGKRGAASRLGPKPYKTWAFEPPCHEPGYPDHPDGNNQGNCSGDWTHNITMYDYLRVPEHLAPGEYVLGFR